MSNDITAEQLRDVESFVINTLHPGGNGESTKKGYKGKPIIVINSGKRARSFDKIMSHNSELLKLLKENVAARRNRPNSSSWPY